MKRERSEDDGAAAPGPSPPQRLRHSGQQISMDSQLQQQAAMLQRSQQLMGGPAGLMSAQVQAQTLNPLGTMGAAAFGGMAGVPGVGAGAGDNDVMGQLAASQMQLLNQSGSGNLAAPMLLQLFALQNQTMTQTMRAQQIQQQQHTWGCFSGAGSAAAFGLPGMNPQAAMNPNMAAAMGGAMSPAARMAAAAAGIVPSVQAPAATHVASAMASNNINRLPDAPSAAGITGRPPIVLFSNTDEGRLTPYQCLARKHLEYFEANQAKVEEGAQGRNKAIVLGQVGIRCVHCSALKRKEKAPAAAFYPSKLSGLYQSAQNIINSHLAKDCTKVPKEVRDQLLGLGNRKSAPGGGKAYWAEEATRAGVFEDSNGLRFTRIGQAITVPAPATAAASVSAPVARSPVMRQLEP